LVFFGGSPVRRYEVTRQLRSIPQPSICGTLSEVEGPQAIDQLSKVALVLIGGRYDAEQRQRIKEHLAQMHPHFRVTEPGIYYPYNAAEIKKLLEILVASV
jgi:hypothetical protein